MVEATEFRNLSEQAHDRIRRDILNGTLFPDERLQIDAMSERYSIGAVPVREALNRLSSEGLVERRSNRGFCVAPISMDDLAELVQTRIWLETLALRQSIANIDEALEEELVVSFHRLARTQRRIPKEAEKDLSEEWERLHKDFHMLLLDRCGSSLLLGFCSNLMDQAVRYRNLSMNSNPSKLRREGAAAEHKAILDAVLDRDPDLACQLLEDHYRTTLEGLRGLVPWEFQDRRPA
ncbi:GntR family transcriptional regulator [Ponticoccus sp. SC2-23]|uniref:GntR family transcriptional regulator n=1 Tax=Alexandriicola marinus TaxID=2081710 RepID=UPI000FD93DF1|nr:GntR family transcriptional regulator [Alexandriicola marinus]MBM1218697.1 GntR family transcriptional regulator [Ponticoccus sp. SC6-9]MBM1224231.1 GntR family transcriptional regulator [Ponticoccus sp. SC6-15]MBM1229990.1 GntR family transcriptional regulator [Ponticoccus sp. SC6-38]MBM1233197.1 GntR family transcriptional regulator [Ponticoccus sp. SC6-45]MBM1236853.1 GntR family transcriptional regulator [Ponticoccus sp. SC6-49]MBM1242208.1 GntR family transcriptional regulator [Pontic